MNRNSLLEGLRRTLEVSGLEVAKPQVQQQRKRSRLKTQRPFVSLSGLGVFAQLHLRHAQVAQGFKGVRIDSEDLFVDACRSRIVLLIEELARALK